MDLLVPLNPLLQAFWLVAILSSLIFLIQTILSLVGADVSHHMDADFGGDFHVGGGDFHPFTLRNLIHLLLGFSWTGISFFGIIPNTTLLLLISLAVGLSFVYLFFWVIKLLQRLAEDNSFKITHTLNKTAEVYLTIPENKSGTGKILISVHGSVHELEAITSDIEKIPSGSRVKVLAIENDSVLLVSKI